MDDDLGDDELASADTTVRGSYLAAVMRPVLAAAEIFETEQESFLLPGPNRKHLLRKVRLRQQETDRRRSIARMNRRQEKTR